MRLHIASATTLVASRIRSPVVTIVSACIGMISFGYAARLKNIGLK